MKKKVIYPGSFDPLTNGHLDIIIRTSKIFETVIVAVAKENVEKSFLFDVKSRKKLIEKSVSHLKNVKVEIFEGLLVEFALKQKSKIIVRGLRVLSDFEYEFRMALMNRKLNDEVTTIFMMPNEKYTHIGSSLIKEVGMLGGKIDDYIPKQILSEVKNKIHEKKST